MPQLQRNRWVILCRPLLVPMVGLVLAAAWLGYGVAIYKAAPAAWGAGTGVGTMAAALALALLSGVMAYRAARKLLSPWLHLAQSVQARAPKDAHQVAVAADAPAEVRAMTEALNGLFARANAESDAQQRFIADAAHQLRTPLAALQAQVEAWALMAQAAPDKSILLPAEQVDHLRQASRRTTQLAHQLLALSRVERRAGQEALVQRVDLKSLCETMLESFLDSAWAQGLDLGLEVEPAHVTGHEWLLRELISNLLDNAIKYTPCGGQVTLRCGRRTGDERQVHAYLEVEDDGAGVPVGEYARLTQRFYRAPGTVAEGTGLGLAIAQEIAQGHGAQLCFAQGQAQRGLRVTLLFKE